MNLKDRMKLLLMSTPFHEMEASIDKFVESIPIEVANGAKEIMRLADENEQLKARIRKLEEENHDLRAQ